MSTTGCIPAVTGDCLRCLDKKNGNEENWFIVLSSFEMISFNKWCLLVKMMLLSRKNKRRENLVQSSTMKYQIKSVKKVVSNIILCFVNSSKSVYFFWKAMNYFDEFLSVLTLNA